MSDSPADQNDTLVVLTTNIVAAHVANNNVSVADVTTLIQNVFGALSSLGKIEASTDSRPEPAVSVRASVRPDYIVCLEDGKKMKMLKRHLMASYNMTPAEYRQRWNLPSDYPMVAPNYTEKRRELAVKIGLGRKAGQKRGDRPKAAGNTAPTKAAFSKAATSSKATASKPATTKAAALKA